MDRVTCSSASNGRRPRVAVLESLAIAGSLAASNCCVIQLLLNYFALGCAGFSALDRWRPFSTALTAASCAALLIRGGCPSRRRSAWAVCLISAALLISQHVLSAHNKGTLNTVAEHAASIRSAWLRVTCQSMHDSKEHLRSCCTRHINPDIP